MPRMSSAAVAPSGNGGAPGTTTAALTPLLGVLRAGAMIAAVTVSGRGADGGALGEGDVGGVGRALAGDAGRAGPGVLLWCAIGAPRMVDGPACAGGLLLPVTGAVDAGRPGEDTAGPGAVMVTVGAGSSRTAVEGVSMAW